MGFKEIIDDFLNRSPDRGEAVDAPVADAFEEQEQEIFGKIEDQRKYREGFYRFIRHPLRVMMEDPVTVLFISVPAALLLLIGGSMSLVMSYGFGVLFTTTMIDDIFVFSLLIAIVPLAILDLKEALRVSSIEASLPNFFRDVAGMNDSGMTLPHAIHIVSEGEYGALTPHVRQLDTEMSWGVPFVEAIRRFGKAVNTPLAERSVDLIAHASSAGGDVSEVLRAAAHDAYEFFNLKSERRNGMMIYMIIIVMSFFVFLFVIGVLSSTFLSTMAEAGEAVAASGSSQTFMGTVDLFLYNRLFSHSALIQGLFSGLAAGIMGEGRVLAGLKYSAIMVLIAWVAFRFFI
ncbi:type II secretion system F family protein [Methanoculleus bourgensis]|jgi:flagellar protein FlaJ|uniref:Type II secretion system F family protein n=1 Tax=Methanoculleus bourgensis TaxID=83986 RepID=A0A7K4C0V1_9EURY|nr:MULTISPECIES: type II secretion system F family protein [Methanoculleus]MBT0731902.1 type II secretion system F family protein [Methanoculleus bourgensis]MDD3373424.1 type II secretion system F family protein [Methanoculleus bourgensis]NMA87780.1 type II secretion system F family protein [Methanoculleus bourgensis]NQS77530.1 type II secretion system F family protein [Methanoculleus bourgensis]SAI87201.1 type II secretion system protein [Methanoculleus bourgensis]